MTSSSLGARAPVEKPAAPTAVQALSGAVLRLAVASQRNRPQTLLAEAMAALREAVPFDSAWWGEVSRAGSDTDARNWLHGSIGLSQAFAVEWNALAAVDDFARSSMAQLGTVVRHHGDESRHPETAELAAFSQRHGLHHCMAITAELPRSGLLFFVSIYRRASQPAFHDEEAAVLGEFVTHLLWHWSRMLEQWVSSSQQPSRPWESCALADSAGRLLFVGLRMGQALAAAYAGWTGASLPREWAGLADRLPRTVQAGRTHRFRLEACGPLMAVSLASEGPRPALAPREWHTAVLYARGHSYKAIAAELALSPSTVRTYLRSAYAALDVRNKTELLAALSRAAV